MNFGKRLGIGIIAFVAIYIIFAGIITNTKSFKKENKKDQDSIIAGIRFISFLLALAIGLLV